VPDYRRSFCVGLTNSSENVEFLSRARSGDEAWRVKDVANDRLTHASNHPLILDNAAQKR
jgi:hypothetical protein